MIVKKKNCVICLDARAQSAADRCVKVSAQGERNKIDNCQAIEETVIINTMNHVLCLTRNEKKNV